MVEGAVGGLVEFFGVEGFVGGGGVGFRRVWRWFGHGGAPRVIGAANVRCETNMGGSYTRVADRDSRTGRPEGLPRTAAIKTAGVVRPEIDGLRDPIADSSATAPQ